MQKIFVSHSHADNAFCQRLVADLRNALGNKDAVWMDVSGLEGGDAWWATIRRELRSRPIFLVILSPHSMSSPWVESEIDIAWKRNREGKTRIIPVLYQPCDIREDLATLQWISFLPPITYEEGLNQLFKVLGINLVRSSAANPTIPTVVKTPASQEPPKPIPSSKRYPSSIPLQNNADASNLVWEIKSLINPSTSSVKPKIVTNNGVLRKIFKLRFAIVSILAIAATISVLLYYISFPSINGCYSVSLPGSLETTYIGIGQDFWGNIEGSIYYLDSATSKAVPTIDGLSGSIGHDGLFHLVSSPSKFKYNCPTNDVSSNCVVDSMALYGILSESGDLAGFSYSSILVDNTTINTTWKAYHADSSTCGNL